MLNTTTTQHAPATTPAASASPAINNVVSPAVNNFDAPATTPAPTVSSLIAKPPEQFKRAFLNGTYTLSESEFLDEEGLPRCKNCGGARYFVTKDGLFSRGPCKCVLETQRREAEKYQKQQRQWEFEQRRERSLLPKRYHGAQFASAALTDNNRAAYLAARRYTEAASRMQRENIGIYFFGDNSTGKSFVMACMCNELMRGGYSCMFVNLSQIAGDVWKNGKNCQVMQSASQCDFLFLDDLGKEFLGREYSPAAHKRDEELLFDLLNRRYNGAKPTVFSSNYDLGELAEKLQMDKGILERLDEMATRKIKMCGDDFREAQRKRAAAVAKELGI